MGKDHVYFLMRWLSSTSSTSPGTNHGQLVAVNKRSGQIAWTANLTPYQSSSETVPAWGNVEPLVVLDPTGEWVLTGDTAGYVSAFDQGGDPRPFALTNPADETPIPCSLIEAPEGPGVPIAQSPRVLLTHRPARTPPNQPWANLAGVGTGMTVAQGRLLMGVNEQNAQGQLTGHLVALRTASNLVLEEPRLEYRAEDGYWQPLPPGAEPIPTGTLRVQLTVRAELDPNESKVGVPIRVGWEGGGYVETNVSFHGPGRVTLDPLVLPTPEAPGTYKLVAILNPDLYAVRYPRESSRPGPGVAPRPAPPPPEWAAHGTGDAGDGGQSGSGGAAAGGPAERVRQQGWGEALAIDGYRSRSIAFAAAPNQRPVAVISGPSAATPDEKVELNSHQSYDPDGDAIVRRYWQVDGESRGESETLSLSFATGGTHQVTLQVQDEQAKWSPLARHTVAVSLPEMAAGACGDPGEPGRLTFDPGNCVDLAMAFDPAVGRRGDKVAATIQLGLPEGFQATRVDVELPEAFQEIHYCLGTGQCFTVDNTDTRAEGSADTWHYDFILAWTQNTPPDGDYSIWAGAQGEYTYTHLHTRTVTKTVCEWPEDGAGSGGSAGEGGPGEETDPADDSSKEPEPICHEEEREEQYPFTHTVDWHRWEEFGFRVEGHWYPYVEMQR